MAKVNIRESLGRLDLLTDNKYDLRNTYDCSNISDDKKKKLAEALNKNASAKEVSKLLSEDYDDYDDKYDAKYVANSYYGRDYSGLEDYIYTDDYSELEDWVWEKIINGGYVEVFNRDSGKSVRLNPDKYDRESDDIYGILDDLRSVNESLNEDNHEQLFKVVISSGATKRDFESALYEDEAEEIVDYYSGRWIDENGFEWNMYVEEDDDSTEHAMVDNSYDMEDDDERVQRECVESLNEANYGGAYDIDPEMFWTKDDLMEFSYAVCEKLADKFGYQYDIADVGAESNNDMYITIMDTTHDIEADVSFRIKMSRIRSPRDLMKYLDTVVSQFVKKFEEEYQYYDFDESLNEDMSKPDFVVGFYAGPVDDYTLELVNPKKIAQVDVSAEELRAKYGKNVDKLLNDYTSQTVDKLKSTNSWLKALILNFAEEKARKTGKLDDKFRNEERKFLETGIYMEKRLEEINYPFRDGIKDLSKKLGKMLLPKRENLTEDVYDEESDFGDGSVEEGDTFIEDGREWSWIERIAGPIHLDFDNWAVWSARDWDYIQEQIRPILLNKEELTTEKLIKIYDEAEVAYFVVDEDTGFIDWGPVENQTEAQDFLNGKVEDYENDEEYREIEIEEESLNESKNIEDTGYSVILHYDDIGNKRNSEYDYEVNKDDFIDGMFDVVYEDEDAPENYDQCLEWIIDNFETLVNKYKNKILDYFFDDAQEDFFNK